MHEMEVRKGLIDDDVSKKDDRLLLFLMANATVPATTSQELYEKAWEKRIRPVDERRLKVGYGK